MSTTHDSIRHNTMSTQGHSTHSHAAHDHGDCKHDDHDHGHHHDHEHEHHHHAHGEGQSGWRRYVVWYFSLALLFSIAVFDGAQALQSAAFVTTSALEIAPYLLVSIVLAAYIEASGADQLIGKAFSGAPLLMIGLAATVGGVSPFCSCGVIPIIAALLGMGVPLAAVMAFWLSSPIMDPSMFFLTSGILGFEFAVAKTLSAITLGFTGGLLVHLLRSTTAFQSPLREGVCSGASCSASKVTSPESVNWKFWQCAAGRSQFLSSALTTTLFLAKWLVLAFLLESVMLAVVPPQAIAGTVGGEGVLPILLATLVGVPAHLNGYAALPVVEGLIEHGMTQGAALSFLVAGSVTSIPCAMAVWALARPRVFALYLLVSLFGAMAVGLVFQMWHSVG